MKQAEDLKSKDKEWQKRKVRDNKDYEEMLIEWLKMELEEDVQTKRTRNNTRKN